MSKSTVASAPTNMPTLSAVQIEPRIVGGFDASAGAFPFFVQWSGCGASLIWEDIILAAAHVSFSHSLHVLHGLELTDNQILHLFLVQRTYE